MKEEMSIAMMNMFHTAQTTIKIMSIKTNATILATALIAVMSTIPEHSYASTNHRDYRVEQNRQNYNRINRQQEEIHRTTRQMTERVNNIRRYNDSIDPSRRQW